MDAIIETWFGGFIMYIIIMTVVSLPRVCESVSAKEKFETFESLGDVSGLTLKDIIAVCGEPTSISIVENGKIIQWLKGGLHIALMFTKNDICIGVSHKCFIELQ